MRGAVVANPDGLIFLVTRYYGKAPAVKNFTARFFKGEKLSFTRQKTKRVKKTKETEEYRYEDEYNLEGLFEGREI